MRPAEERFRTAFKAVLSECPGEVAYKARLPGLSELFRQWVVERMIEGVDFELEPPLPVNLLDAFGVGIPGYSVGSRALKLPLLA